MAAARVRPMPQRVVRDVLLRGVRVTVPGRHAEAVFSSRKALRVKYGIDPTTPELHIGHLAILRKLRLLQRYGHTIVMLIGDFTARFGDPTEKSSVRELRTKEEVRAIARGYRAQIGKILDLKEIELHFNSTWYDRMSAEELLRLMSTATVHQMLERDMFRAREKKHVSIGLHEPVYPILQGYDSVVLKSDLTIVGQDQLFNEIAGRHLQERLGQEPQVIFGVELLVGTDGKQKMSQSLGNDIALCGDADDQFGKLMSIPDDAVPQYAELLTDEPLSSIRHAVLQGGTAARDAKMRVAKAVVAQVHGAMKADRAVEVFTARFRRHETPQRLQTLAVSPSSDIVSLLVAVGAAPSRSAARRLVLQRGVRIDEQVVVDPFSKPVISGKGALLAVGKRTMVKIVPKTSRR